MIPHLENPTTMTTRARLAPALLLGLSALSLAATAEAREARFATLAEEKAPHILRPLARPDPFREMVVAVHAAMPVRPEGWRPGTATAPSALLAGDLPGKAADDQATPSAPTAGAGTPGALQITVTAEACDLSSGEGGPDQITALLYGFETCAPFTIEPGSVGQDLEAAIAYWSGEDDGTIDYAALQDFHLARDLPSVMLALGPVTEAERLANGLEERILRELGSRYDLNRGTTGDLERLFDLADGAALKDWGRAPDRFQAAAITEASFEAPEPQPTPAPVAAAPAAEPGLAELRSFLATPEGLSALARLSPQEMAAVLRIAAGEAPAPAAQPAPVAAQPRASGVPSLRFEGDPDLPAFEAEAASGPVLGGGGNLLLRGWRVARDEGGVAMYLENNPGSRIHVVQGMVLGPLGEVTGIEVGPDGAVVSFKSGDVLREELSQEASAGLEGGVPPL